MNTQTYWKNNRSIFMQHFAFWSLTICNITRQSYLIDKMYEKLLFVIYKLFPSFVVFCYNSAVITSLCSKEFAIS